MKNTNYWHAKMAELKATAKDKKLSYTQIGKDLGYSQQSISRVFQLKHEPKLNLYLNLYVYIHSM